MRHEIDTAEKRVVRYIGDGAYLFGVPARDLTQAEWEQHKALILSSPHATQLYEIPEGDKAAPSGDAAVDK